MKMDGIHLDQLGDIDACLLSWLHSKDRRDERKRLEKYMLNFLYGADHKRKFCNYNTAEIIHENAASNPRFSGKRAAQAFTTIAKYASNLISQPWRREFYEIKLYSGYYKHNIEQGLMHAERMFEAMGYQRVGHSLKLTGVVDPDLVLDVCKDAIMAQLECSIMQEIWDIASKSRVSWRQISEFRQAYINTSPDDAARFLIGIERRRNYQERHAQPRSGYYDPYGMQMAYTVPVYPCSRYAQILSPTQVMPPYPPQYSHGQHVLKPHELYSSNGYHHQPPLNSYQNGYPINQHTPAYSIPTTVPTGKLIELDSSPVHQPRLPTADFPSSKAKNDGAGAWEEWDSVYKNLDSYHKTNGRDVTDYKRPPSENRLSNQLRGMTLARPVTPPRSETDRHRLNKNSIELEDAVTDSAPTERSLLGSGDRINKGSLDSQSKRCENSQIVKQQNGSGSAQKDTRTESINASANVLHSALTILPLTPQTSPSNQDRQNKSPNHETNNASESRPKVITLDVSASFLRDVSPVVELPPRDEWQCSHCTFYNESKKNACNMCNRSRVREEITPYPKGGQECPRCTLVNKRGQNFCSACNIPLKGSPTYV